jgi:hypothetical protein
LKSLELQLEELQKRIQKEKDKALLSAHIDPEHKEVAEAVHKKMCHHNHTDGCGWYYDRGDWSNEDRKVYLQKATVLLKNFSKNQILNMLNLL